MWDLDTIVRINQKAAAQASKGLPERDAVGLATGAREVSQSKDEGEIIKLPSPRPVACACCVG